MNMPEINARPDTSDRRGHIKDHIDRPHLTDLASSFDHETCVSLAQPRHELLKVFRKPPSRGGVGRAVKRAGVNYDFARTQNVGLLIGSQKHVNRAQDLSWIRTGENDIIRPVNRYLDVFCQCQSTIAATLIILHSRPIGHLQLDCFEPDRTQPCEYSAPVFGFWTVLECQWEPANTETDFGWLGVCAHVPSDGLNLE